MYRYPCRKDSDQGSHFKGDNMQDWAKKHDIEQRFHVSYNPQVVEVMERKNKILKQ